MHRHHPRRALEAPWRTRVARVAVPSLLAGLLTTGVVAVAAGSATDSTSVPPTSPTAAPSAAAPASPADVTREEGTSRSGSDRPALSPAAAKAKAASKATAKPKAKPPVKPALLPEVDLPSLKVVDTEYTRVALNVREKADAGSELITVLKSGSKVKVTGTARGDWQYIAYRGDGGWVKKQYLVESKPKPRKAAAATAKTVGGSSSGSASASGGGISGAACSSGSSVESGLTPDAIRLHRALCAKFPGVSAYGGVRADSLPEHPSGRALDAMVSSTGLGQQIADWVRANAGQLGVSEIIFAQRIWTVQRGSEGWRSMSDRGSASANHYDHVHVTVYGNSGG